MITRTSRLPEKAAFLRASDFIFSLCSDAAVSDFMPQDLMFFDIETTGLSPDSSFLYLIGCLYLEGDEVVHTQFFSEGIADERELIEAYDEILAGHRVLAHFNGQTFDVPYIDRKRERFGLTCPVNIVNAPLSADTADCQGRLSNSHTVISFDIFKYLRSYKKFLGMSSMSQKSLEVYCGLNREDIYDGGQLIEVYGRYIATRKLEDLRSGATLNLPTGCDSDSLLRVLLLHNYEDVLGMLEVCRMLALPAFLRKCSASPDIFDCTCTEAFLSISLNSDSDVFMLDGQSVTCPDGSVIRISAGPAASDACTGTVTFTIPVIENEFRLFYSDYKNYYYLPAEDSAIPRSIGEFMDRSLRVKCTPANCCTRHYLRAVPLCVKASRNDSFSFKVFRKEFKAPAQYADVRELTGNNSLLCEYIRSIVCGIRLT